MSFIKAFGSLTIKRSFTAKSLHPKRFTSILDSVPTKPRNPWQIFLRENIKGYKERGEKVDLKSVAKIFGDKWRALPDSEKEKYATTYKKEVALHKAKLEEVLSNTTPKQFKTENALRKKYDLELVKDPRQPKRPKNNFLFYLDHLRSTNDPIMSSVDVKTQLSEAAKKYKTLDATEAQIYVEKAKAASEQYNRDMDAYKQQYI
ncbi:hypothetical protein EDC94DRAFT_513973 [Helicostylum pulchrum]|uniref:HMG box domain-containing protein n=1 Tax=Helicostylum pulchrum TaxID=562976 RepID=A0ABP9Y9S2_9FUNG|nr:hypothetical protein EDC94DRAFT_513973 [Helicostylum pulchrum]